MGSRQESRSPPRSRRDLASPGIFPPGSRQEKNPAIDPAGTPTGNLRLHRDPAKNPDYPEIPPGSCQPGYFLAGIPLGKKSRHKSRRDSHREIVFTGIPPRIPITPRSRRDLANPGIFPPGSRQERIPARTPAGNLCLHGDLAKEIKYSRQDVLFLPAWTKLRRFRNSVKRSKIVAIETNLSRRE